MTTNFKKSALSAFLTLVFLIIGGFSAFAQSEIRGTVYDTSKPTPMTGATVVVQGKNIATITDLDGNFSLNASEGDVLLVQFMGYHDQSVTVGKSSLYEIVMKPDSEQLEEVIVTALGMKREKRSLGYAATDVSGEDLAAVQNSNWLSGLSGKVAGLNFTGASSGPIGSKKVIVRGDASLSGSGGALFVVDGVPINSGSVANASSSTYSVTDAPVDFGDGASDINPDDIESITVLKGAAATALYGSRAGNGAIIITTKSGSDKKGIGVTVNSSFTAEQPGYFPEFQTLYGPGSDLGLSEYNYWEEKNNPEGLARHYSRYSYGEAFNPSVLRYQWDGMNWDTMEVSRTPWTYKDDWYTGIFKTGFTYDNSVSIEGGNGKGSYARLSFKDTRNEWIVPNTGYQKQTISLSVNSQLHKNIKLNARVNYYRTDSDNMPVTSYSDASIMYHLMWNQTNISMRSFYDEYFEGRYNAWSYANPDFLVGKSYYYNPYRVLYEQTNSMDKDRILGTVGLNIDLWKEKLTLDVKTGVDMNNEFRTQKKPFYTIYYERGFYREQSNLVMDFNTDFMLKYQDSFLQDRLTITAGFGGNNRTYNRRSSKYTLNQLDIEGIYNYSNYPAEVLPDYTLYRSNKVVNSLYGLLSLGWNDMLYLDVTARNDWSSTLSRGNWSFFYPSVSASAMLDRMLNLQENAPWITFLKLRGSWANVGRDTDPYALDQYYTATDFPGGFRPEATIPDPNICPENVATWEVGLEAKFLENRIGFDVALYQSDVTNQIYDVTNDYMSGAKYYTENIGLIRNKGIEIAMTFVPVRTKDWNWTINVNAARNIGILKEMYDGWDITQPHETDYGTYFGSAFYVYNFVGRKMGEIWGAKLLEVAPEGSYYLDADGNKVDCSGQYIIDSKTGYPSISDEKRCIGNINPDWTGGISTSLRWKDLTLSMAFSAQIGGDTYSVTAAVLGQQGKLTNTLEGRNDGLVAEGVNVVGTDENGNMICQVNNTITENIYNYYKDYAANRYNLEAYTYDTSFLKLKELRLEYNFPKSLMSKQKVLQGVSLAAYATNVFCLTDYPFYDPEAGTMNGTSMLRGAEAGSYPMARTYGFNLKLKF